MVYKIGIIGVGRWGLNYLKTLNEFKGVEIISICSKTEATIKNALESVKLRSTPDTTTNYKQVLENEEIDGVAIVSPGSTHYQFAKEALLFNKHVIVEKPLAFSSKNVEELIKISHQMKKILMVGHLHLYNPGIQKLKSDIDKGLLGRINFICTSQFGNGPIRSDMSAIWDFFPHTISILLYLLERFPLSVSANGASYIKDKIEDVVTIDMHFPHRIFVTSSASWLYPLKKMDIAIIGEKMYATFDDYSKKSKLKYYDSRPKIIKGKLVTRDKGVYIPPICNAKPLTEQLKHFLWCIKNKEVPLTDGGEALKVVKVLEAAQKSLAKRGAPIRVSFSY